MSSTDKYQSPAKAAAAAAETSQNGPAPFWPHRFRSQVFLVTGAAGGLGSATAERLAHEGATVVCTDLHSNGSETGADPANCIRLDTTSREDWAQVAATVTESYGRLDGALFAHGIQGPEKPVVDMPLDGWSKTLHVNLDSCFFGLAELLPLMTAQEYGRIAILSSISAREGNPHQSAYSASKAALVALVKTAAKEVAKKGVTVNAIAPSMMQTPLLSNLSEERNAQLLARVPMGRVGYPNEFAALATWLLSAEASYMTGQTLDLSGGRNTA